MNSINNILQELGVERDRWDCPHYHATILTNSENFEEIYIYMVTWGNCTFKGKTNICLSGGGTIRLQALDHMAEKDVSVGNGGCEYTSIIINISDESYRLGSHGVNYLMSRLRSQSKYSKRMVLV